MLGITGQRSLASAMISIPLVVVPDHPCGYLSGQLARSAFVHPQFGLDNRLYARLIAQGFRRSGDEVYRPHCLECNACIPARIAVDTFRPDRSQRRCLQQNAALSIAIKPPRFDSAHYDLYLRYQQHRHPDGDMSRSDPEQYLRFLSSSWCDTRFVEFSLNDRLLAVAVVDFLDHALSAVYTFFDPHANSHGLGTYAVLWQWQHARKLGLEYLYLGYWIDACDKMRYKKRFRPLYGFIDQHWQQIPL